VATGDGKVDIFDAVMVCTGAHSRPYTPDIPGLKEFQVRYFCFYFFIYKKNIFTLQGKVMHAQSLHDCRLYEKHRVLVVGLGNSALDAVIALCPYTEKVHSLTAGTFIINDEPKYDPFYS
jgi:cation diffusion facilitator CzcD-associated flavoprotein CzcO